MRILFTAASAAALVFMGTAATAMHHGKLEAVLEARSDEDKARDEYRHPKETLAFFGVEPGMTVIETLPGGAEGGWYTRILVPYLGAEGMYYGANYSSDLFAQIFENFGGLSDERRAEFDAFPTAFPAGAAKHSDTPPTIGAYIMGAAPEGMDGTVDVVLYIRSLHHLNRFETSELDAEAANAFAALKPGGVVGVVQHRAPEGHSDEWADGDNGYLKQSRVVEAFTGAGFTLEGESEMNANPKDQPTEEEFVWRLPPALALGEETKDTYAAIGESDRMTLKFRKPE